MVLSLKHADVQTGNWIPDYSAAKSLEEVNSLNHLEDEPDDLNRRSYLTIIRQLNDAFSSSIANGEASKILTEELPNTLLEGFLDSVHSTIPRDAFSLATIDETATVEDLKHHPSGQQLILAAGNRLLYGPPEALKLIEEIFPDPKDRCAYASLLLGPCNNAITKTFNILVVDDANGDNGGILANNTARSLVAPSDDAWSLVGDCYGQISAELAQELSGTQEHLIQHRFGIVGELDPDSQSFKRSLRVAKGTLTPRDLSQLVYADATNKPKIDIILPLSSFKGGNSGNKIRPGLHTVNAWMGEKDLSSDVEMSISQVLASFPGASRDYLELVKRKANTLASIQSSAAHTADYFCRKHENKKELEKRRKSQKAEQIVEQQDELDDNNFAENPVIEDTVDEEMYQIIKACRDHRPELLESQKITDFLKRFIQNEWRDLASGKGIKFPHRCMIIPSKELREGEIYCPHYEEGEKILNFRAPFLHSNGIRVSKNVKIDDVIAPTGDSYVGVIAVSDETLDRLRKRLEELANQGIKNLISDTEQRLKNLISQKHSMIEIPIEEQAETLKSIQGQLKKAISDDQNHAIHKSLKARSFLEGTLETIDLDSIHVVNSYLKDYLSENAALKTQLDKFQSYLDKQPDKILKSIQDQLKRAIPTDRKHIIHSSKKVRSVLEGSLASIDSDSIDVVNNYLKDYLDKNPALKAQLDKLQNYLKQPEQLKAEAVLLKKQVNLLLNLDQHWNSHQYLHAAQNELRQLANAQNLENPDLDNLVKLQGQLNKYVFRRQKLTQQLEKLTQVKSALGEHLELKDNLREQLGKLQEKLKAFEGKPRKQIKTKEVEDFQLDLKKLVKLIEIPESYGKLHEGWEKAQTISNRNSSFDISQEDIQFVKIWVEEVSKEQASLLNQRISQQDIESFQIFQKQVKQLAELGGNSSGSRSNTLWADLKEFANLSYENIEKSNINSINQYLIGLDSVHQLIYSLIEKGARVENDESLQKARKELEDLLLLGKPDEDPTLIQRGVDALIRGETEAESMARDYDGDTMAFASALEFDWLAAETIERNQPENAYQPTSKLSKQTFPPGTSLEDIAIIMANAPVGIINNHLTALVSLEAEILLLQAVGSQQDKEDYAQTIGKHCRNLLIGNSVPKRDQESYARRIGELYFDLLSTPDKLKSLDDSYREKVTAIAQRYQAAAQRDDFSEATVDAIMATHAEIYANLIDAEPETASRHLQVLRDRRDPGLHKEGSDPNSKQEHSFMRDKYLDQIFEIARLHRAAQRDGLGMSNETATQIMITNRKIYRDMIQEAAFENQIAVDMYKSNRRPNMELIDANKRLLYRTLKCITQKKQAEMYGDYNSLIEVGGYSPVELITTVVNQSFTENRLEARPTREFYNLFPHIETPAQRVKAQHFVNKISKLYKAQAKLSRKLDHERGPVLKITDSQGRNFEITNLVSPDYREILKARAFKLRLEKNTHPRSKKTHSLVAEVAIAGDVDKRGNPIYKRIGTVCEISREDLNLRAGASFSNVRVEIATPQTERHLDLLRSKVKQELESFRNQFQSPQERKQMAAAIWHLCTAETDDSILDETLANPAPSKNNHSSKHKAQKYKVATPAFATFPEELIEQIQAKTLVLVGKGIHRQFNTLPDAVWRDGQPHKIEIRSLDNSSSSEPTKRQQLLVQDPESGEFKHFADISGNSLQLPTGTRAAAVITATQPTTATLFIEHPGLEDKTFQIGEMHRHDFANEHFQGTPMQLSIEQEPVPPQTLVEFFNPTNRQWERLGKFSQEEAALFQQSQSWQDKDLMEVTLSTYGQGKASVTVMATKHGEAFRTVHQAFIAQGETKTRKFFNEKVSVRVVEAHLHHQPKNRYVATCYVNGDRKIIGTIDNKAIETLKAAGLYSEQKDTQTALSLNVSLTSRVTAAEVHIQTETIQYPQPDQDKASQSQSVDDADRVFSTYSSGFTSYEIEETASRLVSLHHRKPTLVFYYQSPQDEAEGSKTILGFAVDPETAPSLQQMLSAKGLDAQPLAPDDPRTQAETDRGYLVFHLDMATISKQNLDYIKAEFGKPLNANLDESRLYPEQFSSAYHERLETIPQVEITDENVLASRLAKTLKQEGALLSWKQEQAEPDAEKIDVLQLTVPQAKLPSIQNALASWDIDFTITSSFTADTDESRRGYAVIQFVNTDVSQALRDKLYQAIGEPLDASSPNGSYYERLYKIPELPENPLSGIRPINSKVAIHLPKDMAMAEVATQFIGIPTTPTSKPSSTRNYLNAWKQRGRANTGLYSPDDVVMISGSVPRRNATSETIKETFEKHYIPLLDAAIRAGSTFVVGNAEGADQLVAAYLRKKKYNLEFVHVKQPTGASSSRAYGYFRGTPVREKQISDDEQQKSSGDKQQKPTGDEQSHPEETVVKISGKPIPMVFDLKLHGDDNPLPVKTTIEAMRDLGRTHTTRNYPPYKQYQFKEGDTALAESGDRLVAFRVGKQYPITQDMILDPEFRKKWADREKHSSKELDALSQKYLKSPNQHLWGLEMEPLGDFVDGQIVPFETTNQATAFEVATRLYAYTGEKGQIQPTENNEWTFQGKTYAVSYTPPTEAIAGQFRLHDKTSGWKLEWKEVQPMQFEPVVDQCSKITIPHLQALTRLEQWLDHQKATSTRSPSDTYSEAKQHHDLTQSLAKQIFFQHLAEHGFADSSQAGWAIHVDGFTIKRHVEVEAVADGPTAGERDREFYTVYLQKDNGTIALPDAKALKQLAQLAKEPTQTLNHKHQNELEIVFEHLAQTANTALKTPQGKHMVTVPDSRFVISKHDINGTPYYQLWVRDRDSRPPARPTYEDFRALSGKAHHIKQQTIASTFERWVEQGATPIEPQKSGEQMLRNEQYTIAKREINNRILYKLWVNGEGYAPLVTPTPKDFQALATAKPEVKRSPQTYTADDLAKAGALSNANPQLIVEITTHSGNWIALANVDPKHIPKENETLRFSRQHTPADSQPSLWLVRDRPGEHPQPIGQVVKATHPLDKIQHGRTLEVQTSKTTIQFPKTAQLPDQIQWVKTAIANLHSKGSSSEHDLPTIMQFFVDHPGVSAALAQADNVKTATATIASSKKKRSPSTKTKSTHSKQSEID